MCRRANSLIISAAPIASTENCLRQPASVTGASSRPSRSAAPAGEGAAAKLSASHPVALFTRMSTGPNRSSAASKSSAGTAGSARSASMAAAVPPPSSMAAMTAAASRALLSRYACGVPGSSGSATRRNVHSTAQPRRARARAAAAPMPWLAPVTIATCS